MIGSGWNIFSQVVSVGYGVVYGLTPDGRLEWFRQPGYLDDSGSWATGSGEVVSPGSPA